MRTPALLIPLALACLTPAAAAAQSGPANGNCGFSPTNSCQAKVDIFAYLAPQLGALVVAEAVRRAGVDPAMVDQCYMGNVVGAGLGQNPARQAALRGGLSDHVGAVTVNMVCGSGLKAVMFGAQGIATGDFDIAVAGGMEYMSNCPLSNAGRV